MGADILRRERGSHENRAESRERGGERVQRERARSNLNGGQQTAEEVSQFMHATRDHLRAHPLSRAPPAPALSDDRHEASGRQCESQGRDRGDKRRKKCKAEDEVAMMCCAPSGGRPRPQSPIAETSVRRARKSGWEHDDRKLKNAEKRSRSTPQRVRAQAAKWRR
jgi:hypothetical protein